MVATKRLPVYFDSAIKAKRRQEDTHFEALTHEYALFALFDGHGGPQSSLYCKDNVQRLFTKNVAREEGSYIDALVYTFDDLHKELAGHAERTGTTATIVVINNDLLLTANVGDSKAVLCRNGKAVDLTGTHNTRNSYERARVERAGSRIIGTRVDGCLNVTRTLGDFAFHPSISALPSIRQDYLSGEDEFLVIASDGLWDAVGSQEAIDLIRTLDDPADMVDRLMHRAERYPDNITVGVVMLRAYSEGHRHWNFGKMMAEAR